MFGVFYTIKAVLMSIHKNNEVGPVISPALR